MHCQQVKRGDLSPLLRIGEATIEVLSVPVWGLPAQERPRHTRKGHREGCHQDNEGFRAPLQQEDAEIVQPEAEEALIKVHKYLKGKGKDTGARLCSVVPIARTGGNGHKLAHRRFPLNTRSIAVLCRRWSTGTGCPEAVGSPPWGCSKVTWM